MKITLSQINPELVDTPLLVQFFTEEEAKNTRSTQVTYLVKQGDFAGESKQVRLLHKSGMKAQRLLVVGLGKEKELKVDTLRMAMASVIGAIKELKLSSACLSTPSYTLGSIENAQILAEGLILANYDHAKYKTEKKTKEIKSIIIVGPQSADAAIKEAVTICANTILVRDMQNENSNNMTTLEFEKRARALAKQYTLKIEVLDENQIKKKGLNLLHAVGSGSQFPPRLIILQYTGNPKSKDVTAIVGKGITFDSGGYNLKPTRYIETMKEDMTGAAIAFAVMKSACELKLKTNLISVITTAENAVSSTAYKPGDVYIAYDGTSVEIGNTDAEGRLVSADANAYIVKNYKPSRIINVATLTGAMVVALGDYVTGIFSNKDTLAQSLFVAGEATDERVWRLPTYDCYKEDIKSTIADIKNIGRANQSGSITAALFLQHFAKETDWAHLDIAGTSWLESARGYLPPGGTGIGVRLLVEFLKAQ